MLHNPYKTCKIQAEEIKSLQYEIGHLRSLNRKLSAELEYNQEKMLVNKLVELNQKNLRMEVLDYRLEITKLQEKLICYLDRNIGTSHCNVKILGLNKRMQWVQYVNLMFDFAYNSYKDYQTLKIQDIQNASHKNKGYGSLAMKMLLEFAKGNRVDEINGKLAERDFETDEERERKVHFYQNKFGFSIEWHNDLINEGLNLPEGVRICASQHPPDISKF